MKKVSQKDLEQFVSNNVIACQSSLVAHLLSEGDGVEGFCYDDITNYFTPTCPNCGYKGDDFEELADDARNGTKWICPSCNKELDDEPDTEQQEIMEWWLVNEWFSKKLIAVGEPVLDNDYGIWWGRTCSGQAISMDAMR